MYWIQYTLNSKLKKSKLKKGLAQKNTLNMESETVKGLRYNV